MLSKDKLEISKEVSDLIAEKVKFYALDSYKKINKFALDMFLEGVKFIPNKTATDSKKDTERG